jgi:hypothetical protein
MLACDVREDVTEMPGSVNPTFRRSNSYLIETGNGDVRGTGNRLASLKGVWAQE